MATTRKGTDAVLASARRELQAQLAAVREEMKRLAVEEQTLTRALSHMDGTNGAQAALAPAGRSTGRAAPAKRTTRRSSNGRGTKGRRRPTKSTADRVKELRTLLAEGEKSRADLAAALEVSPARVQQLLAELGTGVRSRKNPDNARMTLWSLKATANGSRSARPAAGKRARRRTDSPTPRSDKKAAATK